MPTWSNTWAEATGALPQAVRSATGGLARLVPLGAHRMRAVAALLAGIERFGTTGGAARARA